FLSQRPDGPACALCRDYCRRRLGNFLTPLLGGLGLLHMPVPEASWHPFNKLARLNRRSICVRGMDHRQKMMRCGPLRPTTDIDGASLRQRFVILALARSRRATSTR